MSIGEAKVAIKMLSECSIFCGALTKECDLNFKISHWSITIHRYIARTPLNKHFME